MSSRPLLLASCLAAAAGLAGPATARAELANDGEVVVDFADWTGTGVAANPAAGQLDSNDWGFTGMSDGNVGYGETRTSGDYARGLAAAAVATPGLYAFEVEPGNRALGLQPGADDATPGGIALWIRNSTGKSVASFEISYTVWTWNDETRSTQLSGGYSIGNGSPVTVPALGFTSSQAPDDVPGWHAVQRTALVQFVTISPGGLLLVRWTTDDAGGSGGRDQIAIDDVTVRFPVCGDGIRELGETCEQGDNTNRDGCDTACRVEPGWTCNDAVPSVCTPTRCGDGVVAFGGEACDDGDVDGGDGCSATCTIEAPYTCTGTPSLCDVNECAAAVSPCDVNANCTDTIGSFSCACRPGYAGTGVTCADVDECGAGTDACDGHATCANTPGSYTCTCEPGWVGSGRTCSDDDECARNTDNCALRATCTNTPGSYTCACAPGSTGDGVTCTDLDECAAGTVTCGAHATCHNFGGGDGYACTCDAGWISNGVECIDDDECADWQTCDAGMACRNTEGSYRCECDVGFELIDGTCADIDECLGGAWCPEHSTCNNTYGSYDCVCDRGHRDDGAGCESICGNGTIDDAEACDDGGNQGGDGCSATCQPEPGWTCAEWIGCTQTNVCGDGFVGSIETCDDGNTTDGDGCDSSCDPERLCNGHYIARWESCTDTATPDSGCSTSGTPAGAGGPGAGALLLIAAAALATRRRRRA